MHQQYLGSRWEVCCWLDVSINDDIVQTFDV